MTKRSSVVALLFVFLRVCCAQNASVPEAAFLSVDRYTNAFFGFSLPLPQNPLFQVVPVAHSKMGERNLLGLVQEKGRSVLIITALQMMDSRDAERLMTAPSTRINGKEFSKGISHEKGPEGTVWKAMYLTATDHPVFLLEFSIQSFDPSIAEGLEHCVEQTTFFDPAKAREIAGPDARPYNPIPPRNPKKR
jgi:hypothetical protein